MSLKSYDEVISSLIKKKRTPNLMLGNGFSMAFDAEIFSYNSLHEFVEQTQDPLLGKVFDVVKTKNFEIVMQQLDNFCELIKAFSSDKKLLKDVQKASATIKTSLIDAIEKMHPEHVFRISDDECNACASFLKPYLDHGGEVFSTNYDLLLYWVLMRSGLENSDGFGRDRIDDVDDKSTEAEYSEELFWGRNPQVIHHLHGTLPLFDTGAEVIKEQYDGDYLLQKTKDRMNGGEYPIFVAAGNGEEKLNHIRHNQYLSYCYDALCNMTGSLVTFGFNFGPYDEHIIEAVNKATSPRKDKDFSEKLWSIYIGTYSEKDVQHIESIKSKFKCKVVLFDAKTANVWS